MTIYIALTQHIKTMNEQYARKESVKFTNKFYIFEDLN